MALNQCSSHWRIQVAIAGISECLNTSVVGNVACATRPHWSLAYGWPGVGANFDAWVFTRSQASNPESVFLPLIGGGRTRISIAYSRPSPAGTTTVDLPEDVPA